MNDLGWTPVLNGEIYCSPRCGGCCTKAAHDRAQEQAAALCATLGAGWMPRVWENLGWYCEAVKGNCRISPPRWRSDRYMLMWNFPILAKDNKVPQIVSHGDDPLEMLGQARQDARTWIARIEAELAIISEGE
jgi:hypothetical protein